MSVFYELDLPVGAGEAGLGLQCRPSGVLSLLQEAATQAACQLHASGPEVLEKYNALWMVTRMWYRLDRPLMWNDKVAIRTWHRGAHAAAFYRDFDLFVEGRAVGEAVSVWVLVDAGTRKLLRLSDVSELALSGGGELCKEKRLTGIRMPGELAPAGERSFHYSDIDCNGHVNNVRYADAAADALRLERRIGDEFVSSLQIDFLHECLAGETILLETGEQGGSLYVQGRDGAYKRRFDAVLTLDKLPQVD